MRADDGPLIHQAIAELPSVLLLVVGPAQQRLDAAGEKALALGSLRQSGLVGLSRRRTLDLQRFRQVGFLAA